MQSLEELGGSLIVDDALVGLKGLRRISRVGGSLRIQFNRRLAHIEGLERLEEIEGQVLVVGNGALESLLGLGGIKRLKGGLAIERIGR